MTRLNAQGMARRDELLMRGVIPEPGNICVSIDLSAGEPTVTSHFSKDKNYVHATFAGVGKAPYYKNNVLMIDDIYLMVMSVSPIGAEKMCQAFNADWSGKTFAEQWLADSEVIKRHFKKDRQIHKTLALGLGYSMGPKKMVKSMYEVGYQLDLKTAKAFYHAYWDLFSELRAFAESLTKIVELKGYIVNPFGYRLTPEPHKAFNYFIQSTVSGIMHVFTKELCELAEYATFDTIIHDELVMQVPIERLEEFRQHSKLATDRLNAQLQWSVNVRTGFAPGKDWYEAK